MNWTEIIVAIVAVAFAGGIGGLIGAKAQARKTDAEAIVILAQADQEIAKADQERAIANGKRADVNETLYGQIQEHLIVPLELELDEERVARRKLETEVSDLRDILNKEREQRAKEYHTMQIERVELYRGIRVLTDQICDSGDSPNWTPPDPNYYDSITPLPPNKTRGFM